MCYLSPSLILTIILLTIIPHTNTEEWFMPDSHLISDKQFTQLVLEDKQSYKFVKYFSPNCGYCRYLKLVMDKLKHEKEWCFKIYDFNCMWYPQHCQQNVRSGSFPYTTIHDGQGNLVEEIHGFYPEPVIRTIFERIQESCLQMRQSGQAGQNGQNVKDTSQQAENAPEEEAQQAQQQIKEQNAEENEGIQQQQQQVVEQIPEKVSQIINEENSVIKEVHQQQKQLIQHKKQEKVQSIPQKQVSHNTIDTSNNPQPRIITQQSHTNHPQKIQVSSQNPQNKYIKYLIYGFTILIAIYYFHHINKGKQIPAKQQMLSEQQQEKKCILEHNNQIQIDQSSQVQKILKQQSNLVADVLDQEL